MIAARIIGLFCVLLAAGCAGLQRAQPGEPPQTSAMQGGTVAAEPIGAPVASSATRSTGPLAVSAELLAQPTGLQRAQPGESPQTSATQGGTVAVEPMVAPAAPSVTPSKGRLAANAEPSVAKTPAKVLASPLLTEQARKSESIPQGRAMQDTSPPLDLKSLQTRLKETKAIGVFTKLALKNQVSDLLDQFRAFHQGRIKTNLAELRRPYELLLLKVLALLQDTDPPLAGAIVASREAIWSILADPDKFATI